MSTYPRTPEAYMQRYGHWPSVAQMTALREYYDPPKAAQPISNGCDCYDEECYTCNPIINGD